MSKAVLISIRPKWCGKIASGEKTIEVRKNRPRLKTPFKCYIYCTKPRERLSTILKDGDENYGEIYRGKPVFIKTNDPDDFYAYGHSCAVIGEFTCEDIYEIDSTKTIGAGFAEDSCVSSRDIHEYLGGQTGYGWHISDLVIYDAPRELGEFRRVCVNDLYCESCAMYWKNGGNCGNESLRLKRPPQSWCYVEEM